MIPVTFSDLSDITLTMHVADHERFQTPEFLHLKYSGVYLHGSGGANDARFIKSTAVGAHDAWYTYGIILDFTNLDYQWGDEMDWVFEIGWCQSTRCQHPLSIIVGEKCADALSSLSKSEYDSTCVESFDAALKMIRAKRLENEECLVKWLESVTAQNQRVEKRSRATR